MLAWILGTLDNLDDYFSICFQLNFQPFEPTYKLYGMPTFLLILSLTYYSTLHHNNSILLKLLCFYEFVLMSDFYG